MAEDHGNRAPQSSVEDIMIRARLSLLGFLLCAPCRATLIPGPNLAARIDSSDAIVVGTLTGGITSTAGDQISSDFVLKVHRVLKGSLIKGADIKAHLEGHANFLARQRTVSQIRQQMHGIWFLKGISAPYMVLSRDGKSGELGWAVVNLPEGAPHGAGGETPAESVVNELAAALRWLAEAHGSELNTRAALNGSSARIAGVYAALFRDSTESLGSLGPRQTLFVYREFSAATSPHLRVAGIQGLIAASDPDGVKRAAQDWAELSQTADVYPIINSLMMYSNDTDPAAIGALSGLATRPDAEPPLRQNATYALRAVHTKAAVPALIALLDDRTERVQSYALSGLCLFVRNAPPITLQSVPSMSWLESRKPAPWLTPETERHCVLGMTAPGGEMASTVAFWKSWWNEHRAELMER